MEVGVVASELEGEPTGVGRYLEGLLTGLSEVAPTDWRFHLFFAARQTLPEGLSPARFVAHASGPGRKSPRPVIWEQMVLPQLLRRAPHDLLFSPSYSLPPGSRAPSIVTMHDLSFEDHPEEFGLRERWRRRWLARSACRRATRVLVDTPTMGEHLASRYGLAGGKIGVVPIALDRGFEPRDCGGDAAQLVALGLEPGSRYLLFVGSLFERRCPRLMLAVVAALRQQIPDLQLVLAGPNRMRDSRQLASWVRAMQLEAAVRVLGYVPDRALPALYRGALTTLYLSRYEGYGIPPLESLACGTPCIVGPGLALDACWPDYPLRVAELESAPVVAAALRACDRDERRVIAAEAPLRLAALTWPKCAAQFVIEVRRALGWPAADAGPQGGAPLEATP
jgi:glycosyltransferase involved in cell wall biosynthesis